MGLVRQENEYLGIKYLNETENYPIEKLCKLVHLNRSSYCKWEKRSESMSESINMQIIEWIK